MTTSNDKKTYGKTIETIVKFIKSDGIEKGQEFGGYLNCSAVVVTTGEVELTEYQKALIASGDMPVPEAKEFKDSDTVIGVGCNQSAFKEKLIEFKSRIDKKDFNSCYAYVSGTPSITEYKDGRKFINLRPEILVDLKGKDLAFQVNLLKKTGNLWDGIVRPKETVVKTETTSETYANAWD